MNWPKVPSLTPLLGHCPLSDLKMPYFFVGRVASPPIPPALVLAPSFPPLAQLCNTKVPLAPQHPHYITSSWLPPASLHTRPWVPPASPCQAQPNAHLHDQGKFDPGSRSAVKSETLGHLGNCLLAQPSGLLGAQGEKALHPGSARAHPTLGWGCEKVDQGQCL